MAHSKIDNTFNGAMDKLKELSSVFRDGGKLEAACGDDCDLGGVRSAFEELMGAMREAHTEATMEESINEGGIGNIHAMISDADDPAEMVMDLIAKGGPEGKFLYGELEQLATEAGTTFNNAESMPEDFVDELLYNMGIEESIVDEAGAPDYNPSRGEYASNREYGMFSDEGNAEVAEVVDDIVKRHEAGEFDSPERAIDAAMSDLMNLADDNDKFGEAGDTDVRDQVARDLESRIGRDSGFGEAIEYMKKLAGLE